MSEKQLQTRQILISVFLILITAFVGIGSARLNDGSKRKLDKIDNLEKCTLQNKEDIKVVSERQAVINIYTDNKLEEIKIYLEELRKEQREMYKMLNEKLQK